jgi:hypothetical protein
MGSRMKREVRREVGLQDGDRNFGGVKTGLEQDRDSVSWSR